MHSESD